jgi:hypothetical protein
MQLRTDKICKVFAAVQLTEVLSSVNWLFSVFLVYHFHYCGAIIIIITNVRECGK